MQQLLRIGRIFGVIDADQTSPTELQRVVQGARLGPDRPFRNHDHPHPGRKLGLGKGISGHPVFGFHSQNDIQPINWIVQPGKSLHQSRGNIGLAIQCDDDRKDRQGVIVHSAWGGAHRGPEGGAYREKLQPDDQDQRKKRKPKHQEADCHRGHGHRDEGRDKRRHRLGCLMQLDPATAAFRRWNPGFGLAGNIPALPGVDCRYDVALGGKGCDDRTKDCFNHRADIRKLFRPGKDDDRHVPRTA